MLLLVGEGHDFCFYAGAVARTDTLDLSVVKGRFGQSLAQYTVHFGIGVASPAAELLQLARFAHIGETVEIVLSILNLHFIEVYAAFVDAYGSSRLHAPHGDSVSSDGFGQMVRCRLSHASARQLHTSHMKETIEEGTRSDDDTLGMEDDAPHGANTGDFAIFHE